jgi:hypothetical protein
MKRVILAVALPLAIGSSNIAFGAPIGLKPPLNDAGKKLEAAMAKSGTRQGLKIPDESVVGIPGFPDSYVVSTSDAGTGQSKMLPTVTLVTAVPPAKVRAWYATRLKGWKYYKDYRVFAAPGWKFQYLMIKPHVAVTKLHKNSMLLMFEDLPKARTKIEIAYRPKTS